MLVNKSVKENLAYAPSSLAVAQTEINLPEGMREVRLVGVMDNQAARLCGDRVREFMTSEGGIVLLDLSALRHLSSKGVRLLCHIANDLHVAGGELHVAALDWRVKAVLGNAAAVLPFAVHPTLDEAREALLNAAMYAWLGEAVV